MKQFSLEEYLKNPERKVVTRDGRSVRIVCTDLKMENYPVVAVVREKEYDKEIVCILSKKGENLCNTETKLDLFFAPQIQKRWSFMSIVPAITEQALTSLPLYKTREEAEKLAGNCHVVEITWEE